MKKKLLVTAMAAMPVLGMFGGNFASAAVETDLANNATEEVTVTVSQPSTFSVIIPKKIELEADTNTDYSEDYTVEIEGNIAGNETVTVKPGDSFVMEQNNKTDLNATVTQTVQTANHNDLANGKKKNLAGKVEVSGVTAGKWEGKFSFEISLN